MLSTSCSRRGDKMFTQSLLTLILYILLGGLSQAQDLPGGPRYDGSVTLISLTGAACSDVPYRADDRFPTAFRAKFNSPFAEAMTLRVPLGTIFVAADADQTYDGETFEGVDQRATGTLLIDAFRRSIPISVFNLAFTPPLTAGIDEFRFKGTWRNFFVRGCTATVRGIFRERL